MKSKKHKPSRWSQNAERAMKDAVTEVVAEHKARGIPLAVWQDVKIVEIPADKLPTFREKKARYRK